MGCELINVPGGGSAIICSKGQRSRRCRSCKRAASLACDWPKKGEPPCKRCGGSGKVEGNPHAADCHDCTGTGVTTCSEPVCSSCRRVYLDEARKLKLDVCRACAVYAFRSDRRPVRGDTRQCDGCPERVLWAMHPGTGKPAPIAAGGDGANGNVRVWYADGYWRYEVLNKAEASKAQEAGERLYLNHFADCVRAMEFKR